MQSANQLIFKLLVQIDQKTKNLNFLAIIWWFRLSRIKPLLTDYKIGQNNKWCVFGGNFREDFTLSYVFIYIQY